MLQKYCIALENIVYWAQLSARAAPRRTGPDTGQDKMFREGKIMVTSLYQSLCNMETIYADHVAIRYYDEAKQGVAEVYYRQYAQDLRRFVSFLRSKAGDVKGQRVAILARNSYHYIICMYGTVLAGGVAVPLNMGKNWDEIQYELDLVEPVCVLQDGEYLQWEPALADAYSAKLEPMDAFTAFAPAQDVKEVEDLAAMAFIMFTSGTTGRSKGVMLSEKNYFTACQMYIDGLKSVLDYEERLVPQYLDQTFSHFTLVPMFHLAGFICYFVYGIQGWTLNLCCDARDLRRDMSLMHSDAMSTPPVLVEMICNEVKRGHADRLNGLWNLSCSSAILDPAILSDLVKNGFYINQCYSMTELAGYGLLNVTQEGDHLRALGKPNGFCEVKVDETGEICVRGGCVMLGYYKDHEATAETIDKDGWLHTGDLARVDEEGYYYMTGRKKNLIILDSGENVSPEELEKLLGKCDAIKECIVKEMGKKIGTVVCCEDDKQQQVKDFVTELNRTLPMYKRISVVECSAEPLPRNALGKLLRR